VTNRIILTGKAPLAQGSTRDVFWHPGDPDLLIKVIRRDAIEKRYGKGRPWYKTTRRYRHYVSYLREMREEIAVRALMDEHPDSLQKIVGFAETDLGFGLVVEAAKDRDGGLAPTLPDLIAAGRYDAKAHADLQTCLNELLDSPVILADVHGANLVYAWTQARGNHFVLIDGIGCKTLIPLNRMSRWINRYSKQKRIDRLLASVARMRSTAANSNDPLPQAAE
jgi:hypothetical protein